MLNSALKAQEQPSWQLLHPCGERADKKCFELSIKWPLAQNCSWDATCRCDNGKKELCYVTGKVEIIDAALRMRLWACHFVRDASADSLTSRRHERWTGWSRKRSSVGLKSETQARLSMWAGHCADTSALRCVGTSPWVTFFPCLIQSTETLRIVWVMQSWGGGWGTIRQQFFSVPKLLHSATLRCRFQAEKTATKKQKAANCGRRPWTVASPIHDVCLFYSLTMIEDVNKETSKRTLMSWKTRRSTLLSWSARAGTIG